MNILVKAFFSTNPQICAAVPNEVLIEAVRSAISKVSYFHTKPDDIEVLRFDQNSLTSALVVEVTLGEHPEGGDTGTKDMKTNLIKEFGTESDFKLNFTEKNIWIDVDQYHK